MTTKVLSEFTPNLNEIFYWHFHPEYEIVYVEAKNGLRHIESYF
jgi:hypothetical protein